MTRRSTLDARHDDATPTLADLQREIDELRAARERLVLAADADRRGIERELHAGVQQRLVALAVALQLVEASVDSDPARARTLLEELERDVQLALDEAAQLAQRIYPSMLGTGGLAAALRSAAASAGIPVHVRVAATASYPPEVLGTVYWCFLEVLGQARAATETTVTVRDDEKRVDFEMVADGSRRDVVLDRLRDRVEALGGRLAIESHLGAGVRIAGWLPLARHQPLSAR